MSLNVLIIAVAILGLVAGLALAQTQKASNVYTATLYKDVKGEVRWKLTHQNGNIVADSGEGYKNHLDCKVAFTNLAAGLGTSRYNATIYKDVKGEVRWKLTHENGNVVADSGEGYKNLGDCATSLGNIAKALSVGDFTIDDKIGQ